MYEIGLPEFKVIGRITNQNNDYVYTVEPKNVVKWCPECGSDRVVKHKKHTRKVRDLNE